MWELQRSMQSVLQQDLHWADDSSRGDLFFFLQRAVDQMLHDVCMQNLHVIFALTGQVL